MDFIHLGDEPVDVGFEAVERHFSGIRAPVSVMATGTVTRRSGGVVSEDLFAIRGVVLKPVKVPAGVRRILNGEDVDVLAGGYVDWSTPVEHDITVSHVDPCRCIW
jgi:hypothetical protein